MRYADRRTEAAHLLATTGYAEQTVGVTSEDGIGTTFQALVYVARYRLLQVTRKDTLDEMQAWQATDLCRHLNPGHEALVWIVEAEPGHMITHRSVDCDTDGHAERIAALVTSFETVTTHYHADYADYDAG